MKFLHPSFIEVLHTLIKCDVDFLLIGGYAVNYHGYGRPTGDLDIWIRPDDDNKQKCLKAFEGLKYNSESIDAVRKLNFGKPAVFFVGEEPLRIDFLTAVNLINFEDAWKKKNILSIQDLRIPVVDYHHLVLTKISTGRTRDKLDLEELQKINQKKKKDSDSNSKL